MRTINILNAGSDVFHKGDIVDISGANKAYTGRFIVNCVSGATVKLYEFTVNDTQIEIDHKPKKYRSTFVKSHKKVW